MQSLAASGNSLPDTLSVVEVVVAVEVRSSSSVFRGAVCPHRVSVAVEALFLS